jgi:hypothetical protein
MVFNNALHFYQSSNARGVVPGPNSFGAGNLGTRKESTFINYSRLYVTYYLNSTAQS